MTPDDLTDLAETVEGRIAGWFAGHADEHFVVEVVERLLTLADELRPEWRLVAVLPDGRPVAIDTGPTTDPKRADEFHARAAEVDDLAVQIRYVPRHRGGWTTITPEEQP